jgi:hypothetical protein
MQLKSKCGLDLHRILLLVICFLFFLFNSSCRKLLDIDPPVSQIDNETAFGSDATAASVMTGLYSQMGDFGGLTGIASLGGLVADELQAYPTYITIIPQVYANALQSTEVPFWSNWYKYIYTTNAVLEGVSASTRVSDPVKKQLMGEAKFMRAFFYFYLVNFFGDVPLVLTTDYRVSSPAFRSGKDEVYKQIISDLKDARNMLRDTYLAADAITDSNERVRPNKYAATALLARVYLFTRNWAEAEMMASSVINNQTLYEIKSLDDVFLKNSAEAIWQVQPTLPGYNTQDATAFILTEGPTMWQCVSISNFLYNTFELGDKRLNHWIGTNTFNGTTYYFPYKYKVAVNNASQTIDEYFMVLRLAEQYLIRSEARTQLGNMDGAIEDVNRIRERAGLPGIVPSTKEVMLEAVYHERRTELFAEWAHRWLDLKRTGKADEVMSTVTPSKGGTWNSNWKLFPLPLLTALQLNKNLTQNPGY